MAITSREKYTKYLKEVLDLEIELYQLRRLKQNIERQLSQTQDFLDNTKPGAKPTSETTLTDIIILGALGAFLGAILGFAVWLFRIILFLFDRYSLLAIIGILFTSTSELKTAAGKISTHIGIGTAIGAIIFIIISILPLIKYLMKKKQLFDEYSQKESKRKTKIAIEKKKLDTIREASRRCDISIKETEKILNNYYALNVVYKKYRGLVPIGTIYEYFEAGLCSELEGHEGAYLIYERQLQAAIIVGKLDQIIERLDTIIVNQRALSERIQSSNRMIDGMSRSVQKIVENQDINNYYNRINAQNTQFLSDYTMYKELLS